MQLVELSRRINDGQVDVAVDALEEELSDLGNVPILVLGLTYREGVKELAYSRGIELVARLLAKGARVSAWDPLLSADEIRRLGASPWEWATPSDARAVVVQTAEPQFRELDLDWLPSIEVLFDGRNSLRDQSYPAELRVLGVGIPARGARRRTRTS